MWYYLVFILVSELLVLRSSARNLQYVFMLIVVSLASLSFFIETSETWDLYRHHETITMYGELGLDWVLSNRLDQNPLTVLFLYVFSLVNEPRLFQFVAVLVTYGFTLMLLFEVQKEFRISRKSIAWILFYLLSNWNYVLVVGNCRIFMLYAIIAYLFYIEFVRDRHHLLSLIVYIAACFFHYGIAVVLVARIIIYVKKYVKNNVLLILLSIVAFSCYSYILSFMGSNALMTTIGDKVIAYQAYKVFGIWQYTSSLINIVLVLFVFINSWLRSNKSNYNLTCLVVFISIFVHITNYQIIIRETCLVSSLAIVPLVPLFSKNTSTLSALIKIESIVILIYRCWYEYGLLDFSFII